MITGLDEMVEKHLERVGRPGAKPRQLNGTDIKIARDPPEGWQDSTTEYAAPPESDERYPRIWRVSRSWEGNKDIPLVVFGKTKVSETETLDHIFPHGIVGTENIGLAPTLADVCQKLRDHRIDPKNPSDVRRFQSSMADAMALFLPMVYAKIIADHNTGMDGTGFRQEFTYIRDGHPIESQPYAALFKDGGLPVGTERVQTIGGALSSARTELPPHYDGIVIDTKERAPAEIDMSFIAIHRGGILPCVIGDYIARDMGLNTRVIGVDAKRKNASDSHYDNVVGAVLTPPTGYRPSDHSTIVDNAFVFPTRTSFGKNMRQAHLVIDPMLATGVSSVEAIKRYMEATGCHPLDVYAVSLFAGSYEGLNRLDELGVNVITLMHDQCDLTSNGYIQPGLGDAGDKQSLTGRNDTYQILRSMQHLATTRNRPLIAKCLDEYCMQITGKGLTAMRTFADGELTADRIHI